MNNDGADKIMIETRPSVKHTNDTDKSTTLIAGRRKKFDITYEHGNKKHNLNSDVARREGGTTRKVARAVRCKRPYTWLLSAMLSLPLRRSVE